MMRTACIISLSAVCQEPRVIRQAEALRAAGWRVIVAGFTGARATPPWWDFVSLDDDGPGASRNTPNEPSDLALGSLERLYRGATSIGRLVARKSLKPARVLKKLVMQRVGAAGKSGALFIYWSDQANRRLLSKLENVQADLFIAHDWYTAPAALRLADLHGGQYAVDVHEYAREQFFFGEGTSELRNWKKYQQPYIDSLQRVAFERARGVTTVCDGIADLLKQDYGLDKRPAVVRSVPLFSAQKFRPTGEIIQILYHGLIVPTRGLDHAIRSVSHWRPEFHLVIRGHGPVDYISSLKALAADQGVSNRVVFEPSVDFDDIIPTANRADIGYIVLDNYSPQRTFTLPNKFFEYIMAGLAICASDLPEMSALVRRHGLGLLSSSVDPTIIADRINAFTRESIDGFKRASLLAANELCWEREAQVMLTSYGVDAPEDSRVVRKSLVSSRGGL